MAAPYTGPHYSWQNNCYSGMIFTANATPGYGTTTSFLSAVGGIGNDSFRIVNDFDYTMSKEYEFDPPGQPDISEAQSGQAPPAESPQYSQHRNTCQIYHESIDVSYKAQSIDRITTDTVINNVGYASVEEHSKQDVYDGNTAHQLKKIARNVNYTWLNGVYVQSTGSAEAARTRGILTGIVSSAINAAGAALSKDLLLLLFRNCYDNSGGQTYQQVPILFTNSYQKVGISELFGKAPESWNMGGMDITTIETDFGKIGIMLEPMLAKDTILLAAIAACQPVGCPVPGKGILFEEKLSKSGAADKGHIYGQIGLDYAHEKLHGKITGLAFV